MTAKGSRRRLWFITILGIVILLPLGYYTLLIINNWLQAELLEHKGVRATTGTAMGKEQVKFTPSNHAYLGEDGQTIERTPGDEEWRVYYQIDNFNQVAEPLRGRFLQAEKKRILSGKPRFTIVSKDQYDNIQIGDKLEVGWRLRADNKIEVVSAGKPLVER
jgi:hypothetical protein